MCGIAGYLDLGGKPASPVVIRRMTDAIAHRGPDGEGHFVTGPVALGHRRLAIIDLSPAGHQPMVTADGRYALTYNGEIYNFNELRRELEHLGCHFHSRTDSEVALQAYAAWGSRAVERFNGMFALAIWDRDKQELFLARDRYGVKPLYYALRDGQLVFASEAKAILAHPACPSTLDLEGLVEYLTFQNFLTTRTLFKGIQLFPGGCSQTISLRSGAMGPLTRYWDFAFGEPSSPRDEREYIEELDRLLRQAVTRQLVSDVEVGAYLSGGMDSGSITAFAARELPFIRSFTCGFDLHSASGIELAADERSTAEYMSYVFKTEHYEMVLKAGDMERVMSRLAWHIEEPRVGQSYPNFYVAQLASKFVKVVLSGIGGDELFGGYPWRYYRAVVNNDFEHYIDKYYAFWQRLVPAEALEHILSPVWNDVAHVSTRDIFRDVFQDQAYTLNRPEDYINHSLYFEARTFLHGLLLVEDKLSMAHGLETRVPFLDNDLVDFAMTIPARLKLGNLTDIVRLDENEPGNKSARYFQRTNDGKLIFRRVMDRHIPKQITEREKQGFSAPDAAWFKGESIDYVRRRLYAGTARIYDFLERGAVQKLVDEHLNGHENRRLLIWSLLSLESALDAYIYRRVSERLSDGSQLTSTDT